MPAHRSYEKTKKRLKVVGGAVAVLSLVGFGAPVVADKLVTSADIKDRTIKPRDLEKGSVHLPELADGVKERFNRLNDRLVKLEGVEPTQPEPRESKVLRVTSGDATDVDFWDHEVAEDFADYKPARFHQESLEDGDGDGNVGVNVVLLVDQNGDGKVPSAQRFVDWQADISDGSKDEFGLNGDRAVQMDGVAEDTKVVDPSTVAQWYVSAPGAKGWSDVPAYGLLSNVQGVVEGDVLRVVYLIGGNDASWENDAIRVTPLG